MSLESALRPHRIQFVAETTEGVTPTNPAWLRFSDNVRSVTARPRAGITEQRGVGGIDPVDFLAGPEDDQITVEYDLQRWLVSGSNPLDAAGYGILRNADNALRNSLSILVRSARAAATGVGILNGGIRTYLYATGVKWNRVVLTADPGSGAPVRVSLQGFAEKIRSHRIDQPLTAGTVSIVSTSAADTGMTLTVENEGATVVEAKVLNGTTPVVTTATFTNVDAAWLSAETTGNITLTMGGQVIMTIYGKAAYQNREGDRGVPLLGTGTNSVAIGTAYEVLLGDTVQRPGGTDLAEVLNSIEFSVENNITQHPRVTTLKQKLVEGNRNAMIRANLFGTNETHSKLSEHLRVVANNIVWTMTGGTVTLTAAVLTDPGEIKSAEGEGVMSVNAVFTGKGVTVT